jgi:hypothetical protein
MIRRQRGNYRIQQVLDDAEIDRADREMLQPYARARHGSSAIQIPSELVRRFALEIGRLDLVLSGDEEVGCLLGFESIRAGKRYWVAERWGCPETVFSDPKRLSEINSITHILTIEWAIENGFDYCDFALCHARPEDGLLQFNRHRGAALDTIGLRGWGYFHVRLPKVGTAQFLWNAPLFAIENHKLFLHLGLPDGPNDDEVATRYQNMGFEGLFKIYLHSERAPSEHLLKTLRSLYKHQKSPPIIESNPST